MISRFTPRTPALGHSPDRGAFVRKLVSCLTTGAFLLFLTPFASPSDITLRFVGEATFQTGHQANGVETGGLSGITYDADRNLFYAICDHYSDQVQSLIYTLTIDLSDGMLTNGDVAFVATTPLLDVAGQPFQPKSIDAEAIAFSPPDAFYVSSEGSSDTRFKPFIRRFALNGSLLDSLIIPEKFLPTRTRDFGIVKNRGFEGLTVTEDQSFLFTANEAALAQDGSEAGLAWKSPVRIVKYDLHTATPVAEFLYWVEPIPTAPKPANGYMDNGLVELVALDEHTLLAMERSYVAGSGNTVRIYEISLRQADNIQTIARLDRSNFSDIKAAKKRLILDLAVLGFRLDNLEGMTLGPALPDGERALILVSDNNFSQSQITQFLAFAVSRAVLTDVAIYTIQGRAHRSPLLASEVIEVKGIVTHIPVRRKNKGFLMQDGAGDGDMATSEAIYVSTGTESPAAQVGDLVSVSGQVAEVGDEARLTVTQINATRISVQASGLALPQAVLIGREGRLPPAQIIDDDRLTEFDPEHDGIDFYESLEGMRVALHHPVVVGPLTAWGHFVVVPDSGRGAAVRTGRGGLLLQQDDFNPERMTVRAYKRANRQAVSVGDSLPGVITGVLQYSRGNFQLFVTDTLPDPAANPSPAETTLLQGMADLLTVASFNAENLDFEDEEERFVSLAGTIVKSLLSPDILALQEIQDNNGAENNGEVDASQTFQRLIESIMAAGGPTYDFCQIDPLNNTDGGQPGGNIRVGYLFNPDRVRLIRRGKGGADEATRAILDSTGLHLSLSPGRISPHERAFVRTRKSLAAEFEFNGHRLFLINNHLSSRRADDAIFGSSQPPQFHSEIKRKEQALILQGFVHELVARDPLANVMVLGDMNEQEFRAPLHLLAGAHLTNLIERVPLQHRYTYIYQGNSQVLDHVLVSENLRRHHQPEIDIVHLNADFAHDRRASDHDPVVVRVELARQEED